MSSEQKKKARSKLSKPVSLTLNDVSILTVLLGRELYGLDIIEQLNGPKRPFEKIKLGSLYAALNRLEKKGLVSWRWGDEVKEVSNGARRKYYKVTGLGQASLREFQLYQEFLANRQGVPGLARGV